MPQIIITTEELFELVNYAVKKGYTGGVELYLGGHEKLNLDGLKAVIDDAVMIEQNRKESLLRIGPESSDPDDVVPMTAEQMDRIHEYVKGKKFADTYVDRVSGMSFNQAMEKVRQAERMLLWIAIGEQD